MTADQLKKDHYNRFRNIWWRIKDRALVVGMCEEWKDHKVFKRDMYSGYLEHAEMHGEGNTTIDRIDNERGYYPDNCRWSTYEAQENNRRNNIVIEYQGRTQTLSQWVRELELPYHRIWNRIKVQGLSAKESFEL